MKSNNIISIQGEFGSRTVDFSIYLNRYNEYINNPFKLAMISIESFTEDEITKLAFERTIEDYGNEITVKSHMKKYPKSPLLGSFQTQLQILIEQIH